MDDKPSADVAASEVQESGSTETPRLAAGSDLWQMFAPMTGFFREFFRKDHSQFQQRLIGALLVVGLIVGGLGWKVFDSQTTHARQQAWRSWIDVPADIQTEIVKRLADGEMLVSSDSVTAKEYQEFLKNNTDADPMVRAWARLMLAESRLNDGLSQAYRSNKQAKNRKNGDRRLDRDGDVQKAIGLFDELLVDAPKGSPLEQRALYGRAVGLEASFDGTDKGLDEVKAAYNRLMATDGLYSTLAEDRLKAIQSEGTKAFYKWFAKVEKAPEREVDPAQSKTGENSPIGSQLDKILRGDTGTEKSSASPDAAGDVKKKIPLLPLKKPAAEKKKPAAEKKKPAAEKKKPAAEKKKPAEKKKAGE